MLAERLALMEAVLHLIREELQLRSQPPGTKESTERLAAAVQALLPDYTADPELTRLPPSMARA